MGIAASRGTTTDEDVRAGLIELARSQMAGAEDIRIGELEVRTGGLSRQNWFFDAQWRDDQGTHAASLILQRDPDGGLLESDRSMEFAVLSALGRTLIPAPTPYWVDANGLCLGNPSIVVEQLHGTCELFVLNGSRPLDERVGYGREFVDLLAAVARVDWRAVGLADSLADPGTDAGLHELDVWEAELRRCQLEPQPELDLILRWLRARAEPAQSIVLVHGDFKPGNALLAEGRVSALLDWETAHLGDPLEDLGWITNPVRAREHQIAGYWEVNDIVAHYQRISGFTVNRRALRWWNIFSCWKLATIVLTGMHTFVDGRFDRVHHSPTWLVRAMFQMMED